MTGSIFKRKLSTGVSWGYFFFGGWDENGKRIQVFKSGFPTKDAASRAVRVAIDEYEAKHGKVSRDIDSRGRRVWTISFGDAHESGFETKSQAELALQKVLARSEVERAKRAEDAAKSAGPLFAEYFQHWLKEHASRRCAPKTLERYADLGAYLIRQLGKVRLNEMTTAEIQAAMHRLQDHGGRKTETEPRGRPLAPKTVRHMGTLLFTVLSDADRLGVLKIPNPMANRRVLLPKLIKRRPAVLDPTKLQALFDRAQNTRLYPLIVLAAATGCRRGELLALEWSDLDEATSEITVSKSLEQTKKGLRIKTTKSEEARRFSVPEWRSRSCVPTGRSSSVIARCLGKTTTITI